MASLSPASQPGKPPAGGADASAYRARGDRPQDAPPARRNDSLRRELRPAGPVRLDLDVHEEAGAMVLAVGGELDVLTAPRLVAVLDGLIRRTTADAAVDLGRTAFIDSSGLHILLNTARRMARRSRGFAVICKPGPVRSVIEHARLTRTLGVVASLSEYARRRALRAE